MLDKKIINKLSSNPCSVIDIGTILGAKSDAHYPIITEDKQLGTLLKVIKDYTGHIGTKLALQMLSNVAVRPFNIRHATWEQIDIKNKQWIIPGKEMKTKKEHIVPLSEQVLKILDEAKSLNLNMKEMISGGTLVFPSTRSVTSPMSDNTLVGALRRMGYTKEEMVAHSFRGIFSTVTNEMDNDFDRDTIDLQLAHSIGSSVSRAYNRADRLQKRTEMMQWYSDLLEEYQNDKN